jgi:PIN domain
MRSSPFTAVYDACVLYPAPLRDFLMWLGLSGRFRARWSAQIHDEWKRNLLVNRPDLTATQLDRTSGLMDLAIPDALVTGHEVLVEGLSLPDPDDRHVLAAAIRCHASVIVTFNERDFPADVLESFGLEAQHPDLFVENLFDLDPAAAPAVEEPSDRCRSLPRHPASTGTDADGEGARCFSRRAVTGGEGKTRTVPRG